MKWDFSTIPPTAWNVEDGEVVPVDPKNVFMCPECKKWFTKYPTNDQQNCSAGCALRSAEKLAVKHDSGKSR